MGQATNAWLGVSKMHPRVQLERAACHVEGQHAHIQRIQCGRAQPPLRAVVLDSLVVRDKGPCRICSATASNRITLLALMVHTRALQAESSESRPCTLRFRPSASSSPAMTLQNIGEHTTASSKRPLLARSGPHLPDVELHEERGHALPGLAVVLAYAVHGLRHILQHQVQEHLQPPAMSDSGWAMWPWL